MGFNLSMSLCCDRKKVPATEGMIRTNDRFALVKYLRRMILFLDPIQFAPVLLLLIHLFCFIYFFFLPFHSPQNQEETYKPKPLGYTLRVVVFGSPFIWFHCLSVKDAIISTTKD
ncbi:hypothetical protein BO78DRAFT_66252 [Aspergillus sclerotiicarbonarius CBS 121057]|uniref:Uncharacterized protein n=1 Tax=Aspergillus sclerotiicarbonarius (strain CBS 121057 / IBT 28362) TaxID=1448318 RepID=A0A319EVV1_ASPSB|nr:hypothetical protein BO78DRAFT_66252 [Aspergillus sclerotiicarbonarius CBS 121057]